MPDDPPLRRSVRDFIKHYGLSRDQYLVARSKAKIRPKDWSAMLSAKDETALLNHISAEKRTDQVFQHIRERQLEVNTQFAPPPPTADRLRRRGRAGVEIVGQVAPRPQGVRA